MKLFYFKRNMFLTHTMQHTPTCPKKVKKLNACATKWTSSQKETVKTEKAALPLPDFVLAGHGPVRITDLVQVWRWPAIASECNGAGMKATAPGTCAAKRKVSVCISNFDRFPSFQNMVRLLLTRTSRSSESLACWLLWSHSLIAVRIDTPHASKTPEEPQVPAHPLSKGRLTLSSSTK